MISHNNLSSGPRFSTVMFISFPNYFFPLFSVKRICHRVGTLPRVNGHLQGFPCAVKSNAFLVLLWKRLRPLHTLCTLKQKRKKEKRKIVSAHHQLRLTWRASCPLKWARFTTCASATIRYPFHVSTIQIKLIPLSHIPLNLCKWTNPNCHNKQILASWSLFIIFYRKSGNFSDPENCFVFVVFSFKTKVSIILKIIQWNYRLTK